MKLCILFEVCFPSRHTMFLTYRGLLVQIGMFWEGAAPGATLSALRLIYDQQLANEYKIPCKKLARGYSPAPFQCLLLGSFLYPCWFNEIYSKLWLSNRDCL